MSTWEERMQQLQKAREPKPKKEKKPIAKKSAKKIAAEKKERDARGEDDTKLQKWFLAQQPKMIGICQCGCGQKSSKFDAENFRSSISHIFPQNRFESVRYHPLNWVERNYWEGCHTNFDNQGMDRWPNMADWFDIKEKFHALAPLLTDEERSDKFYTQLEKLIYDN